MNGSGQLVATTTIGTNLLTGTLGVGNGGTGNASTPTYGELLLGNASSGYTLTATSSLGLQSPILGSTGQLAYFSGTNAPVGTSSVEIASTGFVGIGTTTPGSIFSVNNILNFTSSTSTFYSTGGLNLTGGCFAVNGTCVGSGDGSGIINSGTQGQTPVYNTTGTTLTATSSLFIAQSGDIGIGTTSPQGALDIENGSLLLNAGQTAAERYTLSGRTGLGFPVPFLTPTTPATDIAFDVGPTSGATDYFGIGVSWIDICDAIATCTNSPNSNYESLRLGIHANGTAFVGSAAGGTGAIHNLEIQPSGGLVIVGTSSTPTGDLQVSGNETQSNFTSTGNTQLILSDDNSGNERLLAGFITDTGYGVIQTLQNGVSWSSYNLALQPKGGNVGVGTSTPYSRLEVWGPDTASTTAFVVANNASTTEFSVYDTGNAVLAGSLTQNSDQRLKTNIQSLDASSSLSLIDELNPVTFNWIDPEKGATPQLGFIAQQVQPVFPTLVSTTSATALTPDGTLSLNYIDLISPIVSAIQALSADVTSIENTIAGFANSFTTNQLTFVRGQGTEIDVQTANVQTLCIGSTCITEPNFRRSWPPLAKPRNQRGRIAVAQ